MPSFARKYTKQSVSGLALANAARNQNDRNILCAGVQSMLNVGAVNDPAETEADRIADQIMRSNGTRYRCGANAWTPGVL